MNKKIKIGIVAFAMAVVVMFAVSAMSIVDTEVADEIVVSDNVAVEIAAHDNSPSFGTNVQWHGKLDVFVKCADSEGWDQVVYGESNLLTNIGANWIRGHLNGSTATVAKIANMSLSNDAGAASDAWTELPVEIAANGLDRATAAAGVVNNGSLGAFNITHTWTATGSQSCQLIGIHWNATDESNGNLFAAVKFTQQNLLVNDQLQAIYSVTMS